MTKDGGGEVDAFILKRHSQRVREEGRALLREAYAIWKLGGVSNVTEHD